MLFLYGEEMIEMNDEKRIAPAILILFVLILQTAAIIFLIYISLQNRDIQKSYKQLVNQYDKLDQERTEAIAEYKAQYNKWSQEQKKHAADYDKYKAKYDKILKEYAESTANYKLQVEKHNKQSKEYSDAMMKYKKDAEEYRKRFPSK
jgi:cell division protein FtsB